MLIDNSWKSKTKIIEFFEIIDFLYCLVNILFILEYDVEAIGS